MEYKRKNSVLGDFITGFMVILIFCAIGIVTYMQILAPEHHEMRATDAVIQLRLDSVSVKLNDMESKLDSLLIEFRRTEVPIYQNNMFIPAPKTIAPLSVYFPK